MIVPLIRRTRLVLAMTLLLTAERSALAMGACTILLKSFGDATQLTLTDLDEQFPEFQGKAAKGVTVTLEHVLRLSPKSRVGPLAFGCKVTFDLWSNRYRIVPLGASATKQPEILSSIRPFPTPCRAAWVPTVGTSGIDEVELVSSLDPVSAEQTEKTRSWLAERGIGAASQALLGRAVAAFIDLKEEKAVRRLCRLKLNP